MTRRPGQFVFGTRFRRCDRVARAFTLIEVLATLLLLAITLPAIMRGISLATSTASHSKHRGDAYGLCESKLNELLATGQWQYGNLSGDFSPDAPNYRWSAEVSNWSEANVEQLDVHVKWNARNAEQTVTLSTLIYPNANPNTAGSSSSGTSGTSGGTSGGVR